MSPKGGNNMTNNIKPSYLMMIAYNRLKEEMEALFVGKINNAKTIQEIYLIYQSLFVNKLESEKIFDKNAEAIEDLVRRFIWIQKDNYRERINFALSDHRYGRNVEVIKSVMHQEAIAMLKIVSQSIESQKMYESRIPKDLKGYVSIGKVLLDDEAMNNLLDKTGIPPHTIGRTYLKDITYGLLTNQLSSNEPLYQVYDVIGKQYHTDWQNVDSAIRHAVISGLENGNRESIEEILGFQFVNQPIGRKTSMQYIHGMCEYIKKHYVIPQPTYIENHTNVSENTGKSL